MTNDTLELLRLAAIVESSDDAILSKTLDGIIVSWNRAAEEMFGYTAAEIVGTSVTRLIPPDHLDEEHELLARVGRGERIAHFDTVRRRNDGRIIDVSVSLSPMIDSRGNVAGISSILRDISARKRAEGATAVQRKLLAVTLSSIGDGVLATDNEGKISFMNPVAEGLTGWSAAEAMALPLQSVFRIVNEQTRQPVENPVTKVLSTGAIVGLANHTVLIDRHGVEHPIDDSAAPIHDDDGNIFGVVMVFRDITERRKHEHDLSRLAAIVESSDDAIVTKTLAGIVTSWNPAAERIFGYQAAEMVGRPITALFPSDRMDEEMDFLRRLGAGERLDHYETERIRKDGRRIHISVSLSPIRDESGQIVGVSKIARDITERKRRELALEVIGRVSEALSSSLVFPATVRHIAELVVPDFADGCAVDLLTAEGELERIALAHRDPQIARRGWEAAPRVGRNAHHPISQVLASGEPQLCEAVTEAVRATLSGAAEGAGLLAPVWLQSYIVVPIKIHGKVVGVLSFIAAGARRYSAPDLVLAQDLAHRAGQAIENGRLYQQAEAANEAKDHFLAMLAHELRNPLGVIVSSVNVLEELGSASEDAIRTIALIRRQSHQLARLLDDLLDVARISQGHIELRRQTLDLREVVNHSLDAYRREVDAKAQSVRSDVPQQPVFVDGDAARLQQTLGNLINNASKYTPVGGSIWLTLCADNGQAILRVRDDGIGIPPERLDAIFDLFTQLTPTLARSDGGLGIGLTLVRRLIELHGGSVRATSTGPGTGSEFEIRLPLAREVPVTAPPSRDQTDRGARTFVLIEDNDDAREVLSLALRLKGHVAHVARTGREGIELAGRVAPDVVIVDIGLPDLSGYEVGKHLRDVLGPGFRLIALSGYGQPDDRRRTTEAGFDLHLVKPIDPDALLRAVE